MSKQEFLDRLCKGLSGLPQNEIDERLTFYSEMIDDRMEEGFSEEEAVLAVGSPEKIAMQVVADIPFVKIAKERIKPKRRLKPIEIVLLALGSPIWVSLGIIALAVILFLYISFWSVIISLWAVFVYFIVSSFGAIVAGVFFVCNGDTYSGIAMTSVGVVLLGLSIFMFYGCKAATNGILILTKRKAIWIKNCFIKKEEA